jgi:hypothetical protein
VRPGPESAHSTTLDTLAEQNRCQVGPTILFDRPRAGTLAPSPHSFPRLGPAVLWASAEPVRWVQGELLKFRPLNFGRPDKDDAVPRVRKAMRGGCEGGPVGTPYNRR